MAPEGFDSVCGTEADQQVQPVQAAATGGDNMAKELLRKGDVYGKQFVVFLSNQAYPTYVVTYTVPDDSEASFNSSPTQVTGDIDAHSREILLLLTFYHVYLATGTTKMGAQDAKRNIMERIFTHAQYAAFTGKDDMH